MFKTWGMHFLSLVCVCCSPFFAVFVEAADIAPDTEFLKLSKDNADELQAMETALFSYSSTSGKNKGVKVDLIAAVHVGESEYYQSLNKEFEKYDAVLYELIAPEGTIVPHSSQGSSSPVSMLQGLIKQLLGLEFQLDIIDYAKPNMVHADLTPEGFSKAMAARGDSIWTLIARILIQSLNEQSELQQDPITELRMLIGLLNSNDRERIYSMRRYLAQNFSKMDAMIEKLEGPKGSTIIADRNAKAIEVLQKQIALGKRHLAIFYGAAHMPDMERRLAKELGLRKTQEKWVSAWRLKPAT